MGPRSVWTLWKRDTSVRPPSPPTHNKLTTATARRVIFEQSSQCLGQDANQALRLLSVRLLRFTYKLRLISGLFARRM